MKTPFHPESRRVALSNEVPAPNAPQGREARDKWTSDQVARDYASTRFASRRGRNRDPKLVLELLERFGRGARSGRLLDLPCGTGRLFSTLADQTNQYVGADVSRAMLNEAPHPAVVADAFRLPFRSSSFETVVCCRLLHHLHEEQELGAVISELARVSSDLVIASFWDADSWPALRRRLGWRKETTGRRPVQKKRVKSLLESAGAEVLGYAHSMRFVSMQCFVAARIPRSAD
ncbi:MAG: SAM-dependent methyltransferase [Candidatus Paceibacteria bacterium]|jgi:SAM-dependent methyltransferase